MSDRRAQHIMQKMANGTLGGQSRVATPPAWKQIHAPGSQVTPPAPDGCYLVHYGTLTYPYYVSISGRSVAFVEGYGDVLFSLYDAFGTGLPWAIHAFKWEVGLERIPELDIDFTSGRSQAAYHCIIAQDGRVYWAEFGPPAGGSFDTVIWRAFPGGVPEQVVQIPHVVLLSNRFDFVYSYDAPSGDSPGDGNLWFVNVKEPGQIGEVTTSTTSMVDIEAGTYTVLEVVTGAENGRTRPYAADGWIWIYLPDDVAFRRWRPADQTYVDFSIPSPFDRGFFTEGEDPFYIRDDEGLRLTPTGEEPFECATTLLPTDSWGPVTRTNVNQLLGTTIENKVYAIAGME